MVGILAEAPWLAIIMGCAASAAGGWLLRLTGPVGKKSQVAAFAEFVKQVIVVVGAWAAWVMLENIPVQ